MSEPVKALWQDDAALFKAICEYVANERLVDLWEGGLVRQLSGDEQEAFRNAARTLPERLPLATPEQVADHQTIRTMVPVALDEPLFEFASFEDWADNAKRRFVRHGVSSDDTLCVDSAGRPCGWGTHFKRAEREKTYPIRVFRLYGAPEGPADA